MKIKCVKKKKNLNIFKTEITLGQVMRGTISLDLTNDYSKQSTFIEIYTFSLCLSEFLFLFI